MAKFLAESSIVPALVTSRSHGPSKESGKLKRFVKMMCSLQTPGLRIRSFSGSNSLDNMVSLGQDFRSKVEISVSSRRGRGTRSRPQLYWIRASSSWIASGRLFVWSVRAMKLALLLEEQLATQIKMPTLEEYGTNLTKLAEEARNLFFCFIILDQIERVVQILGRRTKNNPCLIGESGVGKTAIVEGLAQRIARGDVPDTIEGKKVITLDMGLLVAGTKYRGEFEERLKKLMEEIKQSDEIILFIDEVHTLIGAGAAEGAIDAANTLKPALARGELQCIGATTLDEYRKHIEKDTALERRFQPLKVPEPSVDETIQILKGLQERWEIRYTDETLISTDGPRGLDRLIDETGSRVHHHHAHLPEEAKELEKMLRQITRSKNEAVRGQDSSLKN
ncbi:hypothetical protein V6N13_125103 [Hibiscus sabdariffa]|uniref:AAA+ ATPase domain-containing protein n=1 Tax=Hibiscus sabdariffa TaxID=183260 RepID=A0ABR2U4R1_9ROSI